MSNENIDDIIALAHASGCPIGGNPGLWLIGQGLVKKTGAPPSYNEDGRAVYAIEITPKGQQLLSDVATGRVPWRAEAG
jgi:hypothetical protein